jgi:hypothetical protein
VPLEVLTVSVAAAVLPLLNVSTEALKEHLGDAVPALVILHARLTLPA